MTTTPNTRPSTDNAPLSADGRADSPQAHAAPGGVRALTATFPVAPLQAAAGRTLEGLAIPWNVPGNTSAGRLTAARGSIRLPEDLGWVKLVDNHQTPPVAVGYATAAEDTPQGLVMRFQVARTPGGDQALLEAQERTRDALSVELSDITVDEAGTILDSFLTAVAQVAIPAFAPARVTTVAASHHPERGDTTVEPNTTTPETAPAAPATTASTTEPEATTAPAEARMAMAPAMLAGHVQGMTAEAPRALDDLYAALHRVLTGQTRPQMEAALADIINTNVYGVVGTDGYEGQLWSGVTYSRRFVPLLRHKDLTSWKVKGWKWGVKPAVDDYAGDKTAVPSNSPTVLPASTEAARLAGGHDLDRKFKDFGDTEFISAYLEAMTESYAQKSDAKALAFILANATAAGATAAGGDLVEAAILAADTLEDALDGVTADYVLVNRTDRRNLLNVTNNTAPAYAKDLGFDWDKMIPTNQVAAGTVVAGVKAAGTFYELPGAPIRVEALDIARGGIDEAVFGYYATLLHDARGIQKVTITA